MNTQYETGNVYSSMWSFAALISLLLAKPKGHENEDIL